MLLLLRTLSLSNLLVFFKPVGAPAYELIDWYLVFWVILLSFMLFGWTPAWWLAVPVASLRVTGIISYQLCIILVDSQDPTWRLWSVRRSFLFSLLNFYELIVAFAIIYLSIGCNLSIGCIIQNRITSIPLSTPLDALYYSLVTMVTLGYGDFLPINHVGRGIVIGQLVSEILFLLVVIPMYVSAITREIGARDVEDQNRRE